MDSEGIEVFCEDDFMSKSFDAFEDMRRNEQLVDFKIAFQKRTVIGHRLVLAARIPYFLEIFCSFQEEVTLKEVDLDALELLINFAYSGKIEITHANVVSLLSTSKFLQLTRVYDACWEFLSKRLHSNNVLEIRKLAEDHHCSKLLEAADNYVSQNFEEFTNCESFLVLPFQQLKEALSRDDIKVSTEEKVFEAVIRWVKASPSERGDLLPELLSAVRMYVLTPEYLIERVCTEELVRSSCPCRDLVEDAKSYHLMRDKKSKYYPLPLQPRLYETKPLFSSLMTQSHMHHVSTDGGLYSVYRSRCETFNVKLYDPMKNEWLNLAKFDSQEGMEAVVSLDGVIYIFTKFSVHAFQINTCKWDTSDNAHDMCGSESVSYSGRIYFFGGVAEESRKVRSFDPQQQKMHPEGLMPRPAQKTGVAHVRSSGGTSVALEASIYITGGYFEGKVYNNVERYNPETKQWTKVSSMFWKRYGHGCCNLNEKMYACGGLVNVREPLRSAEVYDPLTDQWNRISSMRAPCSMLSIASNDDKLYVCGKQRGFSVYQGKVEVYDPKRDKWQAGTPIPETSIRVIDKIVLVKSVVSRGYS